MTDGRRHILVIDDHADTAEIFAELLRLLGHRVDTAMNGIKGLEKILQLRPDIVFCDLRLPDISGEDVVNEIRRTPQLASIYAVSLTACADEESRLSALAAGFDAHLVKPPNLDAVERLLGERQTG